MHFAYNSNNITMLTITIYLQKNKLKGVSMYIEKLVLRDY